MDLNPPPTKPVPAHATEFGVELREGFNGDILPWHIMHYMQAYVNADVNTTLRQNQISGHWTVICCHDSVYSHHAVADPEGAKGPWPPNS